MKEAKEKWQIIYRGTLIPLTVDSSSETIQDRKKKKNVFQMMREKNCQQQIKYPVRLFLMIEWEIKRISGKN